MRFVVDPLQVDLDVALRSNARPCGTREWRVHFHVPLFTSKYSRFGSSQDVVQAVLAQLKSTPVPRHISRSETYAWNVLPAGLKIDLIDSIEREYRWVLGEWQDQLSSSELPSCTPPSFSMSSA